MKKTIKDLDRRIFQGQRVFVRVDFNVPQYEDGTISDATRIDAALPTIKYLIGAGAKVILASHLGRPKGRTEKLTLRPVASYLGEVLEKAGLSKVVFATDCVGAPAQEAVAMLQAGEVCVLENLRFHPEEEKNDLDFCKQLAQLADIYVDDAFGTSHRAHASTQGITKFVRPALAGFLLDRELEMLSGALNHPVRPFATIIGGAKVSSKIGVLEHLLGCADLLIIGGAMAFTFLKARGMETGKSLVEHDQIEYCRQLESQAAAKGVRLILPVDLVCAKEIKPGAVTQIFACDQIPADQMGLDVGPETREAIATALSACKTILWNGPLGVFEIAEFAAGTFALIDQLVKLTGQGVTTVIGGGDSVAALKERGVGDLALTHVSTGGGASLEFLEGRTLPGVSCLDDLAAVAAPASI